MHIVAEVHGDERAAHNLEVIGFRAKDIRKIQSRVRTIFRKSEKKRFAAEGPGWASLSEETRERKRRDGLNPRIMVATSALYDSLVLSRSAKQINTSKPGEFHFGTKVRYAVFHDEGRGVPVRELIHLTPAERKAIDEKVAAFIIEGRTT